MSQGSLAGIPKSVILAVRRLIDALESRGYRVESAFIFGSYARGDYIESSDVDLIIVSESFAGLRFIERLEVIYRIEWELDIKPWIEVIPLTREELSARLSSSYTISSASRYWIKVV